MAVSTQTLREEWPEAVTRYSPTKCDFGIGVRVRFLAAGPIYTRGYVDLLVHPDLVDAARALAAVMCKFGYAFVR